MKNTTNNKNRPVKNQKNHSISKIINSNYP